MALFLRSVSPLIIYTNMALQPNWTEEEDAILSKHWGIITAKKIHEMGLLPNRTLTGIRSRAKSRKIKSPLRAITHTSDHAFWDNPNPTNAYWAGEMASDGCIMKLNGKSETYVLQLTISIRDIEHLAKFKEAVKYSGPIKTYFSTCSISSKNKFEKHELCYLRICQMRKCEKVLREKWGIVPRKTYRVAPPALTDNMLKLCYICGYLDGDGTISADYDKGFPYIGFCSCSYQILNWFQEVFDDLFPCMLRGIPTALPRPRDSSKNCYLYTVSGFRALKIIDILSRLPLPFLQRKWKNPRILAIAEDYKQRYPNEWSIRLPIEDEIDAFLQKNNVTPSPSTTFAPLLSVR